MKLNWAEIQSRAVSFSNEWRDARSEKSQKHDFIRGFLRVFGADKNVGEFEKHVKTPQGQTNYIDFYWKGHIAIEMKSRGKRLDNAFAQLNGYMACLPDDEIPDLWMVGDFANIHVYHRGQGQSADFKTDKLRKHLRHFAVIAGHALEPIRADKEAVNVAAAEKMAKLHDALMGHGYSGHDLEVYLARLLFCLFANDTGIFHQDSLQTYIEDSSPGGQDLDARITRLFQDLDEEVAERATNPYLSDRIDPSHFSHINGRLFSGRLRQAVFDGKMRRALLDCLDFDWSRISPAIFGAMFQGVMDKTLRREIGAHYTGEDNILKVIDPLFMDGLRREFKKIKTSGAALAAFQKKLAGLKFLDPACGCGNFLIIAYRELRRLELEVIKTMLGDRRGYMAADVAGNVKVNVDQFYGIEIEAWPCQIARTGMWLMDHLMNMEASEELGRYFVRLPLRQAATIVYANALRMDWADIVPKDELSFILGNPPFSGAQAGKDKEGTKRKKEDIKIVFGKLKGVGDLDYVTAWYKKAADMMEGNKAIKTAFVSTNSITQGEQPAILWKPLMERGIFINFGIPTFKWSNEAKGKAAVHCVIVGFSYQRTDPDINPYLVEAPTIFIGSRSKPLCEVPEMQKGNIPVDDGNLIIEGKDIGQFLNDEPHAAKYVRKLVGAREYINNEDRYCLWLVDADPNEVRKMPLVMERIKKCRQFRLASPKAATRKFADRPSLFMEIRQPKTTYILVPSHSSEKRTYIPIGFMDSTVISTNANLTIADAAVYHFAILTSCVHMAWMRAVCGRLEMRYRYSNDVVYNNFPWPEATDKQKAKIEELAQGILDARALCPKSSLADLYDPLTMPKELLKAHQALDRAVMKLYGFDKDVTEPEIVAELMERHRLLTLGA